MQDLLTLLQLASIITSYNTEFYEYIDHPSYL